MAVQARSALFDLYGDHLRSRGDHAPVAALVKLLAPLGVAAPAVRTAVSRMVREGWLEPVRLPSGPGYALTPRAVRRLDDASARIYRTREAEWDGRWRLIVVSAPGGVSRAGRDRLRSGLAFCGYAPLDGTGSATWIAPRDSDEADALLAGEDVRVERFLATSDDPAGLMRRAWDVEALAGSYAEWLTEARDLVPDTADGTPEGPLDDEAAYAIRFRLVHEWRKFLFRDPVLPRGLLPADWPGDKAAEFFDTETRRLLPAAARFVDACL